MMHNTTGDCAWVEKTSAVCPKVRVTKAETEVRWHTGGGGAHSGQTTKERDWAQKLNRYSYLAAPAYSSAISNSKLKGINFFPSPCKL